MKPIGYLPDLSEFLRPINNQKLPVHFSGLFCSESMGGAMTTNKEEVNCPDCQGLLNPMLKLARETCNDYR